MKYALSGGTLTIILILSLTALIIKGCSDADVKYYDAMNKCVSAGGSWIPDRSPQTSYNSICIAGYRK